MRKVIYSLIFLPCIKFISAHIGISTSDFINKKIAIRTAKLLLVLLLFASGKMNAADIYLTNGNQGTADGNSFANGKDAATYLNTLVVEANTISNMNIYIAGGITYQVPAVYASLYLNGNNINITGGFNPSAPYNYNPTLYTTIFRGTATPAGGYTPLFTTDNVSAKTINIKGLTLQRGSSNGVIWGLNPTYNVGTNFTGNFTFEDCKAVSQSGNLGLFTTEALRNIGTSSLTLKNCYFSGNGISTSGSGVFYGSNHTGNFTFSVQNCSFVSNSTVPGNYGGAISVLSPATVTITNSSFCGNSAPYGGAIGIRNIATTLSIDGSTFSSNTGSVNGGALSFTSHGVVNITNTNFYANAANGGLIGYGGAIEDQGVGAVTNGDVTLTSVVFYNNKVTSGYGGAIATTGPSPSSYFVNNCKFVSNVSGSSGVGPNYAKGGSIYFGNVANGTNDMSINGCIFYQNHGGDNNYTKNGADFIANINNNAGFDSKIKTVGVQSKVQGISATSYLDYGNYTTTGYDFSGSVPLYSNTDNGGVITPTFTCPTSITICNAGTMSPAFN
jgi:hypothetical protein